MLIKQLFSSLQEMNIETLTKLLNRCQFFAVTLSKDYLLLFLCSCSTNHSPIGNILNEPVLIGTTL
jgi:hypothetical protein